MTKSKKPSNQKGKSVYFNIDDPGELRLYKYAMSIKNFSGYMKAMLYSDMMKNNGQTPSPYYAAVMHTDMASQVTPLTVQPPVPVAPEEVAASIAGPSIHTSKPPVEDEYIEYLEDDENPDVIEDESEEQIEDESENQDNDSVEDTPKPTRSTRGFML